MISDTLGSIGPLLAVIVALVIAVFQDGMRMLFRKPKLELSIYMNPPYCHKTIISNGSVSAECYYFRLKVTNSGKRKAESVEVQASELLQKKSDKSYTTYSRFLPMNLLWSHVRTVYYESISPNMFKYCDLGHIIYPDSRKKFVGEDFNISFSEIFSGHNIEEETVLSFDTEVKPFTSNHLIPSAEYRLVVLVGAANSKPTRKVLEIKFDGTWHTNEQEMLEKGINIRIR